MSKERIEFLLPVGRFLLGSLYNPETVDREGKTRVYKNGPKTGQPRPEYYLYYAIPKGNETHWNQTEWGTKIHAVAQRDFPNGQPSLPTFAWKITDGDDQTPAGENNARPCDREGFAKHWIVRLKTGIAPKLMELNGSPEITEKEYAYNGCYLSAYVSVKGNGSTMSPGVYLTPMVFAFVGHGERIFNEVRVDAAAVFANNARPAYVQATPAPGAFNPAPVVPAVTPATIAPTAAPIAPTAAPYPRILNAPPAQAFPPQPEAPAASEILPGYKLTEKALGLSYGDWIAAGHTPATMLQSGILTPAV